MNKKLTTRLIGAEIEYYASSDDKSFNYVDEYYSAMREVNSILLPGTDVLTSLMTLKTIILELDKKIRHPLGTRAWPNSYGFAYNGVHLHLSGKINQEILTTNIFRLMHKHGLSPRTVTSWHIFNRPTNYSFKNKRKHQPVYRTPRGTLEIRVLDLEYFLDDAIIKDLAIAIEGGYKGELIDGNDSWVNSLLKINLDNYQECCKFLDTNLSPMWNKKEEGVYINKIGDYEFNFKSLPDWVTQEERDREQERERETRDTELEDRIESITWGRGGRVHRRNEPTARMDRGIARGDSMWGTSTFTYNNSDNDENQG